MAKCLHETAGLWHDRKGKVEWSKKIFMRPEILCQTFRHNKGHRSKDKTKLVPDEHLRKNYERRHESKNANQVVYRVLPRREVLGPLSE